MKKLPRKKKKIRTRPRKKKREGATEVVTLPVLANKRQLANKGHDTYLIFDVSQSMEKRFEQLAQLLPGVWEGMKRSDVSRVSVMFFSDTNYPWPLGASAGPGPIRKSAPPHVSDLRSVKHGMTALVDAFLAAFAQARKLERLEKSRFVLLTDGMENLSEWSRTPAARPQITRAFDEVMAHGALVGLVGFVTDSELTALRQLADDLHIPQEHVQVFAHKGDEESVSRTMVCAATSMTRMASGQR